MILHNPTPVNKTAIPVIILLVSLLGACGSSPSTNTDPTTGARTRGDGISFENITIHINDKPENRNSYTYGEKVAFVFNGVTGLKETGGKVYPGMSLCVTRNEKDTLVFDDDLFWKLTSGTDRAKLRLDTGFLAVFPYGGGQEYKVHIKIWDKRGDGTFTYEMPFAVEKNKNIKITPAGLTCNQIYLWDNTGQTTVTGNRVGHGHEYEVRAWGMSGLSEVDGLTRPVFILQVTDSKGKELMTPHNSVAQLEEQGIGSDNLREIGFNIGFKFPADFTDNPYRLKVTLADKNSDKKLYFEMELTVENGPERSTNPEPVSTTPTVTGPVSN